MLEKERNIYIEYLKQLLKAILIYHQELCKMRGRILLFKIRVNTTFVLDQR